MSFVLEHPWVPAVVRETLGVGHLETTYERSATPWSPAERAFTLAPYKATDRFLDSTGHKIFSATWERRDQQPEADIISIHGLHDYGTRWADTPWPKTLVDSGFRVTSPDLIGHGRSSGIHGGFSSIDEQVEVVRDILRKVVRFLPASKTGKVFLFGGSLGGLLLLSYARKYRMDPELSPSGMVVLCPLVSVAPESRPAWSVEMIAKSLCYVAPFLPLAEANRGKNASDIRFEEIFLEDPLTYHGRLRISTGLAMLHAFEELQANLSQVITPFIVVHGDADRATSVEGSKQLYEQAGSTDKTIRIVPGQEHDLSREPKAMEVLSLCIEWMKARL
ncbi:hypothetical protein PhCBS80983_g01245 [Powellomyces hirtus]|uniref:Serine aminopeptidase S33 domain-containing protein n=1 Tax=Powellomyces hirtus TaxID=109895 RepID=A0A507EBF2_9FUNG|nr:hypothetical protein PhCBS80983_g01245 [Powellomyces hirtus]